LSPGLLVESISNAGMHESFAIVHSPGKTFRKEGTLQQQRARSPEAMDHRRLLPFVNPGVHKGKGRLSGDMLEVLIYSAWTKLIDELTLIIFTVMLSSSSIQPPQPNK